jgi:hypothetical protein
MTTSDATQFGLDSYYEEWDMFKVNSFSQQNLLTKELQKAFTEGRRIAEDQDTIN